MADVAVPLLQTAGLTVTWPGQSAPSLILPALSIAPGERVLIAGPTGSGKSTLLHLCCGLLSSERIAGDAVLSGIPLSEARPAAIGMHCGVVFQTPADQILAPTVREEIALGLRVLGLDEAEIERRITEVLTLTGMLKLAQQPPSLLSGGEQQRVALAAALARKPRWLLLDEPFAQLDPPGALALTALLNQVTQQPEIGLVIAEHRHALARSCTDRVIRLEEGTVVADGPVHPMPLPQPAPLPLRPRIPAGGQPLARLEEAEYRYPDTLRLAFKGTLVLPAQGVTVLLGNNGSGKSSLLSLLLEGPSKGRLVWAQGYRPRIAVVPQQAEVRLLGATIAEDLAYSGATPEAIARLSARMRLPPPDLPPLAASKGERLRIAIASALLEEPDLLLLDEPTAGQDAAAVRFLAELLLESPCPVILATHDPELAASAGTRFVLLHEGTVSAVGESDLLQDLAALQGAGLLVEHSDG